MSVLARLFVLMLLAVLPGLLVQLLEQDNLRTVRREQAIEEVKRDAFSFAGELQQILDGAQNVLHTIASAPDIRRQDWAACNRFLAELGASSPIYLGFGIAGRDGTVVCTSMPEALGLSVATRDYFRAVLETGQPGLGTYTAARPTNTPVLPIAHPLLDSSGAVAGVVVGALRLDWLAQTYEKRPQPPNALLFLADRNGTVLVRLPDHQRWVGQPAPETNRPYLERNQSAVGEAAGIDGVRRIFAYDPATTPPAEGLHIVVGLPTDYVFGPVERASSRGLIVAAVSALLAAAALFFGGAYIINRPLRRLGAATDAIRKGDYEAVLKLPAGRDEFGQLAGAFRAMAETIAEREKRLRDSEFKYRALMEALDDGVFVAQDYKFVFTNPALPALLGYEGESLAGAPFEQAIAPEDLPVWRDRFTQRVSGTTEPIDRYEVRMRHKSGQPIWTELHARRIEYAGHPAVLGIIHDISARRRTEERLKLLAAEVDHRAKNVLAVVQAMVRLTRAESVARFRAAIEGRIATLARAHTLLSQSRWQGADLRRLVEEELAPHRRRGESRVHADGPPLALAPAAAQSMAMAVHELVTNAAKHGALSVASGQVIVDWRLTDGHLVLQWKEQGGPIVASPTQRGIGTGVIERAIREQLGGTVTNHWHEEGLVCTITVPSIQLAERTAA